MTDLQLDHGEASYWRRKQKRHYRVRLVGSAGVYLRKRGSRGAPCSAARRAQRRRQGTASGGWPACGATHWPPPRGRSRSADTAPSPGLCPCRLPSITPSRLNSDIRHQLQLLKSMHARGYCSLLCSQTPVGDNTARVINSSGRKCAVANMLQSIAKRASRRVSKEWTRCHCLQTAQILSHVSTSHNI